MPLIFRTLYHIWPKSRTKSGKSLTRYALSEKAGRRARKISNLGDKNHAKVLACKRAGWFLVEQYKSGSRYQIIQMINHYKQNSTKKNKIKTKTEQPQQQITRKRRSVVRQETPSPHTTNMEYRLRYIRSSHDAFVTFLPQKTLQTSHRWCKYNEKQPKNVTNASHAIQI